MFNLAPKLQKSTNVQFSTSARLTQNPCYRFGVLFSSWLSVHCTVVTDTLFAKFWFVRRQVLLGNVCGCYAFDVLFQIFF